MTFNLRYPGQHYDAETGLHYNWHRYYDPKTGRYLTPDPIGLDGGLARHVYANGNPVMNTDWMGLRSLKDIIIGSLETGLCKKLLLEKGNIDKETGTGIHSNTYCYIKTSNAGGCWKDCEKCCTTLANDCKYDILKLMTKSLNKSTCTATCLDVPE